jgi:hypothetical protein
MNPKTRTITLSDRPPIRIVESEWPVIARAGTITDGIGCTMHVRQHADRRTIVTVSSAPILLAARIRDVAMALGRQSLADHCIADLPAERI